MPKKSLFGSSIGRGNRYGSRNKALFLSGYIQMSHCDLFNGRIYPSVRIAGVDTLDVSFTFFTEIDAVLGFFFAVEVEKGSRLMVAAKWTKPSVDMPLVPAEAAMQ